MIVGVFGRPKGGTSAVAGVVRVLDYPMWGHEEKLDDVELYTSKDKGSLIQSRGDTWAFKHPFLDTSMMFGLIPGLKPIYVFRDPVAVITHHKEYAQQEQVRAELLEQLRLVNQPAGLYVSYERLLENTEKEVRRIAEYVDRPFNEKAVSCVYKGYHSIKTFL